MRYGMAIDLKRCVGCNSCTLACKISNGTPPNMFYSHVAIEEKGKYPNAQAYYTPVLCNHCENAPCVTVCPTRASYRDGEGIVCIDHSKCIGCRYCIAACPYEARTFLATKIAGYFPDKGLTPFEEYAYKHYVQGTVYKCDFCKSNGKTASDEGPACVQTCPGRARIFGDLDDAESEVSLIIANKQTYVLGPEFETKPHVHYAAR